MCTRTHFLYHRSWVLLPSYRPCHNCNFHYLCHKCKIQSKEEVRYRLPSGLQDETMFGLITRPELPVIQFWDFYSPTSQHSKFYNTTYFFFYNHISISMSYISIYTFWCKGIFLRKNWKCSSILQYYSYHFHSNLYRFCKNRKTSNFVKLIYFVLTEDYYGLCCASYIVTTWEFIFKIKLETSLLLNVFLQHIFYTPIDPILFFISISN